MKGLAFITPLVPKVLDGSKPVTRRLPMKNGKCRYREGEIVFLAEAYLIELPGDYYYDAEGLSHGEWPEYLKTQSILHYKATTELASLGKWKSPRFMPEWASRQKLRIKSIRRERLQEITEEDAVLEGIPSDVFSEYAAPGVLYTRCDGEQSREAYIYKTARAAFAALWDSSHKPPFDFASNPEVDRIEFERVP